jgi:hypothetical protein
MTKKMWRRQQGNGTADHARLHTHFIQTSASWLILFQNGGTLPADATCRCLRQSCFRSVAGLKTMIHGQE